MSDVNHESNSRRPIPTADQIETPGGRTTWRIAGGVICAGRAADPAKNIEAKDYRTKEKIVGRLLRTFHYEGTSKESGLPYSQLEADIETGDEGIIRLKIATTDTGGVFKPGVSVVSFAEGLLDLEKDELFVVTARQGSKVNKYGNKSTYANLYHLDEETLATRPCNRRPPEMDLGLIDQFNSLLAELQQTSHYADRPASESAGDDEMGENQKAVLDFCKEAEWPTFRQATDAWIASLKLLFPQGNKSKLSEYAEADWAKVLGIAKKAKDLPPPLKKAKEALIAAKIEVGYDDPFEEPGEGTGSWG